MRVADRLTQREASWRELERLVDRVSDRHIRRCQPADVLRLGQLYRGVCSDLMLAESYDLPRDTVAYLHGLVGRATMPCTAPRDFASEIGAGSCSSRPPGPCAPIRPSGSQRLSSWSLS